MTDVPVAATATGLRFERPSAPVVSVVVLAWKLVESLEACLRSLAAQVGAPPFEVVVVDNGADDDVRRALDAVEGCTIVSLPRNAGFGRGCQAGLDRSEAPAVVLLNDDAVAEPTWLAELAARAGRPDRPAAVGSMLLSDDGTVQEIGSRVLGSAGTVQFGRGLTIDEAREVGLLDEREVDYCSAAALWVDRVAYDSVGGFDDLYFPAYYEDVDLQLRLRAAGGVVVVQPSAIVTHHSGGSTDGMPRFREFLGLRNGALFAQRWRETLASAPEESSAPDVTLKVAVPNGDEAPTGSRDVDELRSRVTDEYIAWLGDRLDGVETELGRLSADHATLQEAHHEVLQLSHSMRQHIEHLEARPTTWRDRLRR